MGLLFEYDDATQRHHSQACCRRIARRPACSPARKASDVPFDVADNGTATQKHISAYIQDEWKLFENLTINYGLRWDRYEAFSSGDQLSPRVNVVWQATDTTTVHAGYSRYFSPPPFENIATESIVQVPQHHGRAPNSTLNDTPKAERANYVDAGISQKFGEAHHPRRGQLLQEVQGPDRRGPVRRAHHPHALQLQARQAVRPRIHRRLHDAITCWPTRNVGLAHAEGKDIVSSQFQFDPGDLAYIQDHFIHLDHEQYLTVSGGASYKFWEGTRAVGRSALRLGPAEGRRGAERRARAGLHRRSISASARISISPASAASPRAST